MGPHFKPEVSHQGPSWTPGTYACSGAKSDRGVPCQREPGVQTGLPRYPQHESATFACNQPGFWFSSPENQKALELFYYRLLLKFSRCDRDGKKQGKSDGERWCLWTSQIAPQMPSLQATSIHCPTVKGTSQEPLAKMTLQIIILQSVFRFQAKTKASEHWWTCVFFVKWNDKCNVGKSSLEAAAR